MPRRQTATKKGTHKALKNTAFESVVVSWLMHDGWQVFVPILDHGHQTDVLISDGPNYYRIQVKTVDCAQNQYLTNRWKDSHVDVVIVFARSGNWGYVMPAFEQNRKKINHKDHQRFDGSKKDFLKAFHKLGS